MLSALSSAYVFNRPKLHTRLKMDTDADLIRLIAVQSGYINAFKPVALPHSAVGWSAVCDCGIS